MPATAPDPEYIKNSFYDVFGTKMPEFTSTSSKNYQRHVLIEMGTRAIMDRYTFATIEESKDILYYDEDKGVYVSGGDILIDKEVEKSFHFALRANTLAEIKGHVMRQTYKKMQDFDSNLDIINMKNGLYNWRTNTLEPHRADYLSMMQCPIQYDPKAKPKYFKKFLKEVLYPEYVDTALEIIAYTFIRIHLFDRYFIFVGNGSNGKSVLVGVITALHGPENVSNSSLNELVEDHFALSDLVGKNVNVDIELSKTTIKDMSILKKITGNQPIRVQAKFKPAFDAVLWAKPLFCANQLPVTDDHSDAHYRREIILPFPYQFRQKNKEDKDSSTEQQNTNIKIEDIHLLKKLTTEKELSGIFNLVVKYMKRIDKNGKISGNSRSIEENREKAELTRDPVGAFVDICRVEPTVPNSKSFVDKDTLYNYFEKFCQVRKLHVLSYGEFAEILTGEHGLKKKRKMILGTKQTIWYVDVKNPTGEEEIEPSAEEQNNENPE